MTKPTLQEQIDYCKSFTSESKSMYLSAEAANMYLSISESLKKLEHIEKRMELAISNAFELLDIELHTEYESRLDELTRAGQEMGDYERA